MSALWEGLWQVALTETMHESECITRGLRAHGHSCDHVQVHSPALASLCSSRRSSRTARWRVLRRLLLPRSRALPRLPAQLVPSRQLRLRSRQVWWAG